MAETGVAPTQLFGVLGFLLTLVALAIAMRRSNFRFGSGSGGGGQGLKVIDSITLSPKTRLLLVESEGNRILLAVGQEQTTIIGTAAPYVMYGEPYLGHGREVPDNGELH